MLYFQNQNHPKQEKKKKKKQPVTEIWTQKGALYSAPMFYL